MSKKFIFITAIVLVICAVFIFAQKRTRATDFVGIDLSQYLSAEGSTLSMAYCVDFEKIVSSGLLDKYIAFFNEFMASAKPEDKAKFEQGWAMIKMQLDAYNFDFKRDLKKFFFSFQGNPETEDFKFFMLVNANFPQDKLIELINSMGGEAIQTEKYKDGKIYYNQEDFAFSFIDNKVIALGMNTGQIKSVMDSYYAKTSPKKIPARFEDMIKNLSSSKIAWGYVYIPQNIMEQIKQADEMMKYFTVLLDIDLLFATTDFDGKYYEEEVNIFMRNPKSATLLADAILGAKSIAKMFLASDPMLVEMLDNAKVSTDRGNNSIRFSAKIELDKIMAFTKDLIKKAIEKQRLEELEEIQESQMEEIPDSEAPAPPQK
jgi:hypothetical protein